MRTPTIVLVATLLLTALPALAQDPRSEFGAVKAHLLEAVVTAMYPGATVEWGSNLTLVQGGTRRTVRIADVDYRPDDGGGYTGVLTVEMLEGRQAIADALAAYQPPPARSIAEVAAFKTNAQFAVTALRRGNLADPASAIEEVEDVELATLTYEQPWPDVYVTYTGLYGTTEAQGEIRWDEKLVVEPAIAASGRNPSLLWRSDKGSSTLHTDTATVAVVDENTVSFASAADHNVISRCADPCLPDGRVLLALWWTTAKTVAVTP